MGGTDRDGHGPPSAAPGRRPVGGSSAAAIGPARDGSVRPLHTELTGARWGVFRPFRGRRLHPNVLEGCPRGVKRVPTDPYPRTDLRVRPPVGASGRAARPRRPGRPPRACCRSHLPALTLSTGVTRHDPPGSPCTANDSHRGRATKPPRRRMERPLRIGVPRETSARETRVAATPATVAKLLALGYDVVVETGAGEASSFPDEAYAGAGATRRHRGRGLAGRRRPAGQRPRARRDRRGCGTARRWSAC